MVNNIEKNILLKQNIFHIFKFFNTIICCYIYELIF